MGSIRIKIILKNTADSESITLKMTIGRAIKQKEQGDIHKIVSLLLFLWLFIQDESQKY